MRTILLYQLEAYFLPAYPIIYTPAYFGNALPMIKFLTARDKKSLMKFELKPKIILVTVKIISITASRRVKSEKREIYRVFRVPKATRLYLQVEYTAERTIPEVAKIRTKLLFLKIPRNSKISPRKFDVPGKLLFARVNLNRATENRGLTVTRPP